MQGPVGGSFISPVLRPLSHFPDGNKDGFPPRSLRSASLLNFFKTPVILSPSLFLTSMQTGKLLAQGTALSLASLSHQHDWALALSQNLLRPGYVASGSPWIDMTTALPFLAASVTSLALNYGPMGMLYNDKIYPNKVADLPDRFPSDWKTLNRLAKRAELHVRGGFFAHADLAMQDSRPLKNWITPGLAPDFAMLQGAARLVGSLQDYGASGNSPFHKLLEYGLPGTVGKFKAMPAIYATALSFFASFFIFVGLPDDPIRMMVAANGLLLGPVIFGMLMTAFRDNKFAVIMSELAAIFVLDVSLAVVASPAIRPEIAYFSDLAVRTLMISGLALLLSRRAAATQPSQNP